MTSLTNCEFMVKGYHYTKPTDPIMTDSCRLYLDTTIDGEESNVDIGDYSWIKYYIKATVKEETKVSFEGYLPDEFWTSVSQIYPKDLNGNATTTAYFIVVDGDEYPTLDIGTLVASTTRVWSEIEITGAGTYSYTDPDFGTIYNFTLTEVEYGDIWETPETSVLTLANIQEITENLIPSQDNLIWTLTLSSPYLDENSNIYIYASNFGASQRLNEDWILTPSSPENLEEISYTQNTHELIMTYSSWSNEITPYVRYKVGNGYLIHLKGIHGFYVQT